MIPPAKEAEIRRLYFAEHWRVGTIASEVGVHPDTVRRVINSEAFAPRPRQIRPTFLDPYKELIAETLEKHPRLRATRLYDMLTPRGYTGSVVQLRRYVKTVRPRAKSEAFLRLETLPGEQGQVDWGSFGKIVVGSATRLLSCFVLVLSFSRAMFARFFLSQTTDCFLQGHVEAFEALGGVPRTLLYDNLKSVVAERDGDLMRLNPRILELAGHYHFAPRACAPYRGNEKGKVERTIRYIRESFFAARKFNSVEDLNDQLARWIEDRAHQRMVPGDPSQRTVEEALADERQRLLLLPRNRFSTDLIRPARAAKTPYIRFDRNDYSIPHTLVRQPLTLVASETRVRILDDKQAVVADHRRSYDHKQRIEEEAHLDALKRAKRRASASTNRQRLMSACSYAAPFFAELIARDEPMRAQCLQLNRLLDAHGASALNAALAQALECGAVTADSVAHLLDQERRRQNQPPPLMPVALDDPRIRAIHVVPHSLTPYDDLAAPEGDGVCAATQEDNDESR